MSPPRTTLRHGCAGLRVAFAAPTSGSRRPRRAGRRRMTVEDHGPSAGTGRMPSPPTATPKYPRDFKAFDWVNPDAPKGGTLYLGNPDRRTSFDKFNPVHAEGQPADGRATSSCSSRSPCRSGDEPGTVYGLVAEEMLVPPDKSSITLSHQSQGALQQRRPGHRRGRQALVRHADEQGRRAAVRAQFDGRQGAVIVDDRTIRVDLKDRTDDTIFNVDALPRLLAQVGRRGPDGKPKPFDQVINEYPITTGALRHREHRLRAGPHRLQARSRLLGARPGRAPRSVQLRPRRLPPLPRPGRRDGSVQGGRVRHPPGVRRLARTSACHDGAKWRDGRIIKKPFEYGMGKGMQAYLLNLRRPIFQDRARARGARLHATTSRRSTSTASAARTTACSRIRTSPRRACRARASSRSSSRSAASCRLRCSASRTCRRARTPAPTRCART